MRKFLGQGVETCPLVTMVKTHPKYYNQAVSLYTHRMCGYEYPVGSRIHLVTFIFNYIAKEMIHIEVGDTYRTFEVGYI